MPGFPLAAIGAGLGQWAQQYQQQQLLQQNQQDQQLRRQLQMMQLRQLLEDKASQTRATDLAAGFLTGGAGGGAGIGPVNPVPGGGGPPTGGFPMSQQPMGTGVPIGRPALSPGVGGAIQGAGDQWAARNIPLGIASGIRAGPWTASDATIPPEAYSEVSGPGAPVGGPTIPASAANMPPPRSGGGPNTPQMAQAAPQRPAAPGAPIGAAPPEYDPSTVAAALRRDNPGISNKDLVAAVHQVGEYLGPRAKSAYDRWKTQAELYYRGRESDRGDAALAETTRYHNVEAGLAGQRIGQTGQAQAETGRHNVATETLGGQTLAETTRQHDLQAKGRDRAFDAKMQERQGKVDMATTEMKTLAGRARELYAAVEANPNLVGVKGRGQRFFGGVAEQARIKKEDEASAAFLSELNILKAGLQASKFQGARYFSKGAMDQLSALVPGEGALDNPTKVRSALRSLAERLEEKATEVGASAKGVAEDFSKMSDQDILRQLGASPGQQ